jgi:hypothetical protein
MIIIMWENLTVHVKIFSEKELMGNAGCCGQESSLSREKLEKSSQRKVILDTRIVQSSFPLDMSTDVCWRA